MNLRVYIIEEQEIDLMIIKSLVVKCGMTAVPMLYKNG